METAIKVGNEVTKQSSENLKDLITSIFASAEEHRMDQATVVEALSVIKEVTAVREITITGCSITGDKHVHMDND